MNDATNNAPIQTQTGGNLFVNLLVNLFVNAVVLPLCISSRIGGTSVKTVRGRNNMFGIVAAGVIGRAGRLYRVANSRSLPRRFPQTRSRWRKLVCFSDLRYD
ncbi:hypothetical protein RSSM_02471 [Rhodopirellula sallentina SM41]|uniref:Uncharacterized protein n=1 Tax=Rhodopirellula sallentina SM41 TaxID=1263870 RepID=M5UE48_9BACT|nr:hypothetical protein RSSM_02471 [Rhodopirellula sallentina SM41]